MMKRLLLTMAGGLFVAMMLGACASPAPRPTHYWESNASTKQYNADNSACEAQAQLDANGKLDPDSTSFTAYRDCMIQQGYTLRTY